ALALQRSSLDRGRRKRIDHLLCRLDSVLRPLRQAATDETIQRRRDLDGERRRIVVEDRVSGLDGGVALERAATREHLVDDGPESKAVGALIRGLAPNLLGRHVADRAEDRA